MVVEYLLVVGSEEMRTSGQYVPRKGENIQLNGLSKKNGMYVVTDVVNHVEKKNGRETLDAGLPRLILSKGR